MILFVDASAMVAMMTNELGAFELEERLGGAAENLCSALSLWESACAVSRKRSVSLDEAEREVRSFVTDFGLRIVETGDAEYRAALDAHHRYGKGRHRAKLNMGDCFAYACAMTNGAKLLYKGDDFSHTDLA